MPKRKRKISIVSEDALHQTVADFLRIALPPSYPWTTIGHGGGGRLRGARLNGLGLHKGWPDIQILQPPNGRFLGPELKRPVGGRPSEDQLTVHALIRAAGGAVAFCRSLEEVEIFLRHHGVPLRATAISFLSKNLLTCRP
jgi:hypothetical protein